MALGMALGMLCRAQECCAELRSAVQSWGSCSAGFSRTLPAGGVSPHFLPAFPGSGAVGWQILSPVPCGSPSRSLPARQGVPTLSESSSMRVVSCTSGALGTTTGMGGRVLPRVPMDAVFTACTAWPGAAVGTRGHGDTVRLGTPPLLPALGAPGRSRVRTAGNAFHCHGWMG